METNTSPDSVLKTDGDDLALTAEQVVAAYHEIKTGVSYRDHSLSNIEQHLCGRYGIMLQGAHPKSGGSDAT